MRAISIRARVVFLAIARTLLMARFSVVVDAWNLEASDRRRWEELAAETGAELRWIHLDTPVEECIRRDALRPHPVGARRILEAAKHLN